MLFWSLSDDYFMITDDQNNLNGTENSEWAFANILDLNCGCL